MPQFFSSRYGSRVVFVVAALLIASFSLPWATCSHAAEPSRPSAMKLLPKDTFAMVSIPDTRELTKRFMNTSTGRMSQDPQMKPLITALYGAVVDAAAEVEQELGLTISEILEIPQGELTVAFVKVEGRRPAVVIFLDVGGQRSQARKLIDVAEKALKAEGHDRTVEDVSGTDIIGFDGIGPQKNRQVSYFEKDDTFCFCLGEEPEALKDIIEAWDGGDVETLSKNQDFGAIMRRCAGSEDEFPLLYWFADPIAIVHEMARLQDSMESRVMLAALPVLGLDGVSGIGGTLAFDTSRYDAIMHAHLLLAEPRVGVVKMIALRPGDVTPERWVPVDCASYTTLNWDVQETYSTLSTLFDSFYGEGAFGRELERRIIGPTGIDFEQDIIDSLDGRASMVVWFSRPVSMRSQGIMIGLKLTESEPVEKVLEKVVKLAEGNIVKRTFAGKTYYQPRPPRMADIPEDQRPPMPCFGVLDDSLLLSNNEAIFKHAVTSWIDKSKQLANELDFKLIASRARRQPGGATASVFQFERPEESLRFGYELINAPTTREGLARGAEDVAFLKSVQRALKENPLPPFEVLRRYFAPTGAIVVDDNTGLHYMQFGLKRSGK